MDPDPDLIAGIGIICLLILAFTSAVDAAFTSVSWRRLTAMLTERSKRSPTIAQLINDPYRFKATIILLNTSATIAAAASTLHLTQTYTAVQQTMALVLLVFVILAVSAVLPKALAVRDPQATVLALAGPFSLIAFLLSPLVSTVGLLTRPLARLSGNQSMSRTPLVFEEELRLLVNAGEEEGFVEHEEREMIEGIFTLSDTIVREVMVPRVDVIALEIDTPLEEALTTIIQEGHSRIPVYDETIDNVVGVLYAKDLLPALRNNQRDTSLKELLRPVHYVPEMLNVDALLKDLQKSKVHIAVVVDEYGGTAGLVTIEDLLEEIVGEIQDEYDFEDPLIETLNENEFIVHARTLIDDFNEITGKQLASNESDRIGGLVYEKLGRMPKVADEVKLENGAIIKVLTMVGVRPQKVRITFTELSEEEDAEILPDSGEQNEDLLFELLRTYDFAEDAGVRGGNGKNGTTEPHHNTHSGGQRGT